MDGVQNTADSVQAGRGEVKAVAFPWLPLSTIIFPKKPNDQERCEAKQKGDSLVCCCDGNSHHHQI